MQKNKQMKKYSDWFKVDLHIHTDSSKRTKQNDYQGAFDINTLKQKLIDNDVKLFSMTDHNIINVEAYKDYISNYKEGDPKLLIGCEFDIEVPESGKTETYHSLIIFEKDQIEDVLEISGKIEKIFKDKGMEEYDRRITIDDLYQNFNGYEYFFIPHAGNSKSIVDVYKKHDITSCQQMVLLMPSAFEKVPEKYKQIYNEGFDKLKTLDFKEKDDIPYINFSDNHNCNKYPCTNKNGEDHQFYCIKGQPSFESIRFAFIDPESRIKKFSEVLSLRRVDNYIERVSLGGNDKIKDVVLDFSPNLNVIIGGRSSGKSLLFSILGAKINIKKNHLSKYKDFGTESIFIKSKVDIDFKETISYNNNEVIYINQGDIVNYFENNSLKDLISESDKGELYQEKLQDFRREKLHLETIINNFIDSYSNLLNSQNNAFIVYSQDIKSILDDNYIIKSVNNNIIKNKHSSLIDSQNMLSKLVELINQFENDTNLSINEEERKIISSFKELVLSKENLLKKTKNIYLLREGFINGVQSVILKRNSELNEKSREKEAANSRLINLKNNITEVIKSAKDFLIKSSDLETYNCNMQREITINEEVSVILEVEGKENIKDKIYEGLNITKFYEDTSIYRLGVGLVLEDITVKNFVDNLPDSLKKKVNTQLKSFRDEFEKPIEYLKYSEDSTSKSNSPGYNSERYLETILKNGKSKIIFIDQPEDNLGNKFIASNLIDIIRKLKFTKQIFLVTHNPSIVVYGDAECIILCENIDNVIQYKQLVLEKKVCQQQICEVLDGGHYIFDQRAKKYNIKKLIQD